MYLRLIPNVPKQTKLIIFPFYFMWKWFCLFSQHRNNNLKTAVIQDQVSFLVGMMVQNQRENVRIYRMPHVYKRFGSNNKETQSVATTLI